MLSLTYARLLGAWNTREAPVWGSACKTHHAMCQSCHDRGRLGVPRTQEPHQFLTFFTLWVDEQREDFGLDLDGWRGERQQRNHSPVWQALEGLWKPLAGAPDSLALSQPPPHLGAWRGPAKGGLSFPPSPAEADSLSSSWSQASWVRPQAVAVSSCVSLGKQLTLSRPRFFL